MATEPTQRSILHVDMDAFFASVEQRDNPALRGKAVVVGGSSNRGVVAAASYESRHYGIRSAMPMAEARRRCPDLIRITPRINEYKAVSRQIFSVFREFTPVVEGLSLDEAFLDVSASLKLFGTATNIAKLIKQRIFERTRLKASVGVASNKLLAKIASDLDKPDGLFVIEAGQAQAVLDPLPVSVLPGIGRETLSRLHKFGIHTVAELRHAAAPELTAVFGRHSDRIRARAEGIDDRAVISVRQEKSISSEETYATDLTDPREIERQLLRLADKTSARLRKSELQAGTVQIKIRRADFRTYTRQQSLTPPVNSTDQIYGQARALLDDWLADNPATAIRLLGVGCSGLVAFSQGDLFASEPVAGKGPVDETVDEIRERFGSGALARARTLERRS